VMLLLRVRHRLLLLLLLRVRQLLLLQDRYCDVAVIHMTYFAAVVVAGKTVVAAPGQIL
jgi:hypothetical protein